MDNFFSGETHAWTLLTIVALAGVSVLSRSAFFLSDKDWALPQWVQRGLQYAPIAALTAVIAPDILMTDGAFTAPWRDARVWASVAAAAFYFWRRRQSFTLPLTIAVGIAVYLPLRLGLNW